MKTDLREKIRDIIGEDAYNEGAFMFDDNKIRFCFTPDELLKKEDQLLELVMAEKEKTISGFVIDIHQVADDVPPSGLLNEIVNLEWRYYESLKSPADHSEQEGDLK